MKKQQLHAVVLSTVLGAGALMTSAVQAEPALDSLVAVSQDKVAVAKKSQARVNKLQDDTTKLIDKYKQVSKGIEGLKVYNAQLNKQLESQRDKIKSLEEAIGQISVVQRGVGPMVVEMLDGIEQFITLDIPYHREKRLAQVEEVRDRMDSANFTQAEKFRQVLKLYSIESDASRKVRTDTTELSINGEVLTVDLLAVGRIALLYQTQDQTRTGAWDKEAKQWVELDGAEYKKEVKKAILIAQKRAQMDIMELPVPASEAAR